jgi:hypothetical protein
MKLFVTCCLTSKKQYIFIARTSLHPMINHIGNRWRCDETMNERGDNGQGRNQIFCRVAVHELSITDVCSIWLLQFVFFVQWVCCFHRTRPSLSTAHQADAFYFKDCTPQWGNYVYIQGALSGSYETRFYTK